ncbi:hypothetical protein BWQ96_08350 [Gracilariopsis chorda]|uniref:Uncharacterized protein n=1 Tax=Gracilariopsis chorda TaxID=448386 RepID=A0A2V3ILD4_9FLOR|nr:hypothetical protein BWQ96_08350 [Gracilariopsis chorda]|eukprot:PXF41940.1 hypothetical protein BWQ96_08350 [Gracilariopsis chorda]
MPRSVYVVKGEGVRDSVWTPKALLSIVPVLPQSIPELVQTIPSPNCCVNPIVQVFVQAPSNSSDAHLRLAERSDSSRTPNNAVVTPSVVPLRTPTTRSSSQTGVLQVTGPRGNDALASFNDTAGISKGGTHLISNKFHSSQAEASNDVALGPQTQHSLGRKSSSNDSFRTYNGSPMIAAVLVKGSASEHIQNVLEVSGSRLPPVQNNLVPSMPSSALNAPSTTGIALQTVPSFTRDVEASSGRTQNLRESSARKENQSLSIETGISKKPVSGAAPKSGNRASPSASVKGNQTRSAGRSGLADNVVSREQKKAMQDIVDRRNAQRRAARSDNAPLRPLTPLSKFLEKSTGKSLTICEKEGTPKAQASASHVARVSNSVPVSSSNDIIPDNSSRPISRQHLTPPPDNDVTTAKGVSQEGVPSSQHQQVPSLKAREEMALLKKNSISVSQKETIRHVGSAAKNISRTPSKGQEPAEPTRDGFDLNTRESATGALQSAPQEHRSAGEHHSLKGGVKPDSSSKPTKSTERPGQSSAVVGIQALNAPFPSSQSLGTRMPLQRDSILASNVRVAENQYFILIDSIFTLSSQIMGLRWHKSSRKTENELVSTWKRRTMEAIVSHYGNTRTALSKKRLHSSENNLSSNRVQKYPLLPAPSDFRKSRAANFSRRSTRFEVQQSDIRSFKDMFQSWEECMGEGPVQQFQADALHLKCVTEALREGKRVFLSNEDVLPMFREFIYAKIGIEVITEKISMTSTNRHKVDSFPSIQSWLRTTESILSWFAYLGNRMEVLLKVKEEPLASELAAFCAEFTRRLLSSPTQVNTEKGDGLKIAGSLRSLKKVVATLPSNEEIASSAQKSQHANKLTAFLSQYVQSFRRLSVTMARHAMPPSPDASRSETSRSETRSEDPAQRKGALSAREDSSSIAQIAPEGHSRVESRRKQDVREERAVLPGVAKVVPEPGNSLQYKGTNQGDRLRRGAVNLQRFSSEAMNKRGSDHSAHTERARGRNAQRDAPATSFPSIPRKPSNVDNTGRARVQSRPSQNNDTTSKRVRTGPAATVHRMLADATSDTLVGSKKRKRGDGILQNFNDEAFGDNGMRLNRPKRTKVRFGGESEGKKADLPDKETIKTLFSDGSDLLGARNALQEAAVSERARKLSRRSVSRCFGFLRTFVSDLKSELIGQPHIPSDVISDPYPPSAIRNLARI